MTALRDLLVACVFFLLVSVTATVIPVQDRLPSAQVTAGRSSAAKPLVTSPHNVPRTKTSRQLPYAFKDVRGVSSIQDRNGHLVCAVDPERTLGPGEEKKPLLQMCPFDSNNLEEQGLMFIGWHGNIRKNIDTIGEGITSLPRLDRSSFRDGFPCYDSLMVARLTTQMQRLICLLGDDEDSCAPAMCGIFANKNWWLDEVGKAVFSPEILKKYGSPRGVLKFYDEFINDGGQKFQDKAIAAFRYVNLSEKSMSLTIPEEYTSGLIAVCAPDKKAEELFELDSGEILRPESLAKRKFNDTVREFFGKDYESMESLSYHSEVVVGTKWNALQL
ncbi:hypothetical protein BKA69DRAFT_1166963 [Paraphysoderma sedebokerense]|nr:hypothetical protein BKA69DRAFT_1168230 [Paraphysoderma sedebokerense]KAI9141077.1 hypothetical protein BKA69DRAFT_1166963 [Paraphysoderma sedebokerense]